MSFSNVKTFSNYKCGNPSCFSLDKLFKCSRCHQVHYCGKICQKIDLLAHKPLCFATNFSKEKEKVEKTENARQENNFLNENFEKMEKLENFEVGSDHFVCLLGFCASHLNSFTRMSLLFEMLKSYKKQTIQIPMFVSVSIGMEIKTDPSFREEEFKNMLSEMFPDVFVLIHEKKLTQFEHVKILFDSLPDDVVALKPFVLFSEDDDVWHPTRAQIYRDMIRESNSSLLFCPYFLNYKNGVLAGTFKNDFDVTSSCTFEHDDQPALWKYCVSLSVLESFFAALEDAGILNSILSEDRCDLFFCKYISNCKPLVIEVDKSDWMYMHTMIEKVSPRTYLESTFDSFENEDKMLNSVSSSLALHFTRFSYFNTDLFWDNMQQGKHLSKEMYFTLFGEHIENQLKEIRFRNIETVSKLHV